MSDLEQFRRELKRRITAAASAPRWPLADFEQYMAALQPRRQRFDEIAKQVVNAVVKPRLDALVKRFPGARMRTDEQAYRYSTWFAQSDRFPVTAKLEFAIEHDQSVEHVFVRYEANLMPVFFHYQPHDKLTIPLDQFNPERATEWVERRIFEFLVFIF